MIYQSIDQLHLTAIPVHPIANHVEHNLFAIFCIVTMYSDSQPNGLLRWIQSVLVDVVSL